MASIARGLVRYATARVCVAVRARVRAAIDETSCAIACTRDARILVALEARLAVSGAAALGDARVFDSNSNAESRRTIFVRRALGTDI